MGQMRKNAAASGPKMTEAEITKAVKDYTGTSYKPKKPVTLTPQQRRREDEENSR